ncbi:hypothetical protein MVEN_01407800 [Mycena venus]|uniref:F-box domain-containing protein n=1 Tax=Mycena venus TaxID=2733690 RepID=A0A8H6XZ10_9AGAR|nr:hypothetical protein MVEN_01407800 [Mycena venus]
MVSADNVNLDVLELIFAYLFGNDLTSIALVSRSFFAGVIPHLYSTLLFRLSHAKRYPAVMSPFAAIAAHPEFAIHVRHVDIRTVPVVKTQYNPKFLSECTRALDMCPNITSFRCSTNALPPFIGALGQKERLRDLRIHANLTTDQSTKLIKLSKIRNLTLDFASWNIMNLLPQWTELLQSNLTTLTLFMANELNETVLGAALAHLPGLLGLHVVGCAKIDHATIFNVVAHTPLLESLSMTTGEGGRTFPQPPTSLPCLRNLTIDVRLTPVAPMHPPGTSALSTILSYINASSPRLVSFIVKYPDRQIAIQNSLVQQLISAHASTLKNLSFIDCTLGTTDSLAALCRACTSLERLEMWIPVRDLTIYTIALSKSSTLRTLVDVDSHVHTHNPRPTLAQDGVRFMMASIPTLQKIVSDGRIWTRRTVLNVHDEAEDEDEIKVGLERRPTHGPARHWFMPRRE